MAALPAYWSASAELGGVPVPIAVSAGFNWVDIYVDLDVVKTENFDVFKECPLERKQDGFTGKLVRSVEFFDSSSSV